MHKDLSSIPGIIYTRHDGVACNPSTREMEEGGTATQGQIHLHSKRGASLNCMSLKTTKRCTYSKKQASGKELPEP